MQGPSRRRELRPSLADAETQTGQPEYAWRNMHRQFMDKLLHLARDAAGRPAIPLLPAILEGFVFDTAAVLTFSASATFSVFSPNVPNLMCSS